LRSFLLFVGLRENSLLPGKIPMRESVAAAGKAFALGETARSKEKGT
jgi:hypothetical protein